MANIPNFPPLTAIQDPAVRQALQAIIDHLRVRSGEAGDGRQKFITQAELAQALYPKPG